MEPTFNPTPAAELPSGVDLGILRTYAEHVAARSDGRTVLQLEAEDVLGILDALDLAESIADPTLAEG